MYDLPVCFIISLGEGNCSNCSSFARVFILCVCYLTSVLTLRAAAMTDCGTSRTHLFFSDMVSCCCVSVIYSTGEESCSYCLSFARVLILCAILRLSSVGRLWLWHFLDSSFEKRDLLSHIMIKPIYAICKRQRCRSACASAQSDQRLYCSLFR